MTGNKDMSAATHFGRQMKKERLARGWSLQELSGRTAYDPAHLSRIENGVRPPTRTLAIACDAVFPERRGWFTEYYDESRQWAEVPPGFRATMPGASEETITGRLHARMKRQRRVTLRDSGHGQRVRRRGRRRMVRARGRRVRLYRPNR